MLFGGEGWTERPERCLTSGIRDSKTWMFSQVGVSARL